MNKFHILTIASIGLFIGFFLGYYILAVVHLKLICMPSGRVLLDKNLLREISLNVDVGDCKSIHLSIEKSTATEIIFGSQTPYKPESLPGSTEQGTGAGQQPSEGTQAPKPPSQSLTGGTAPQPPNATAAAINLKIFDICSADINPNNYPDVSDCLGLDSPYFVIIEKNSQIKTSFYGNIGFNKTYGISDSTPIFYVFVLDLATLGEEVQAVEMYGSLKPYFSIGSYSINDVLQEELKMLRIQRAMTNVKVLSFPLSVSSSLPKTSQWNQLSFYIRTAQNLYAVGDLWFYVI